MRGDALPVKLVCIALVLSLVLGVAAIDAPARYAQTPAQTPAKTPAQTPSSTQAPETTAQTPAPDTPPLPALKIPFPDKEKLVFEVKLSKFPIYATLGHVTFEYLGETDQAEIEGSAFQYKPREGERLIHLRAEAISKGFLVNLFGLDVKDRFVALVNRNDFSARLSFKEAIEGKKHLLRSALFDQSRRAVVYHTVDLNKSEIPPVSKELYRHDGMQSLLSAIYYLRLQKLEDGQLICFPVSEDEENHQFEIVVAGRAPIEVGENKTKVSAIVVEPKLFGPGRFFSRPGEMTMWLSDDERRIPLRLQAKTTAGTLTVSLINYEQQPEMRSLEQPAGKQTGIRE